VAANAGSSPEGVARFVFHLDVDADVTVGRSDTGVAEVVTDQGVRLAHVRTGFTTGQSEM
jgi:hypothetical protein